VTDRRKDVQLRSLLFAPGNHPRRLQRVADFGSDVIVLDLEDTVADSEKDLARGLVREAVPAYGDGFAVAVRVNGVESRAFVDDIAAVVCQRLDAIVVPKLESPQALAEVDRVITQCERATGRDTNAIAVIPILESALGIARAEEICANAPARVLTVCFGLLDFALDVGIDVTVDGSELLYARSRVVVAARAAGLPSPIDGPWLWLDDLDGLAADTVRSRRLGFQGRVVVHSPHVEPVQRAYSELADDELHKQEEIVRSFEEALAQGSASICVSGTFVDYPVYERAKRKLAAHDLLRGDA
jgi:citrate lyase subunit beta / citryl-CoA lyase